MKLTDVMPSSYGTFDVEIKDVSVDSRTVQSGDLFIALPPLKEKEGLRYIEEALQKGAKVLIKHKDVDISTLVSLVKKNNVQVMDVENPRKLRSEIASNLYPSRPDVIVAVTGTNGKSSVAYFSYQLWQKLGRQSAFMGTIGAEAPQAALTELPEVSLTSLDPFVLHRCLTILKKHQVNHLSLEASSHGLDQYRLEGVSLAAAAFTNLEKDHLDYHQTMDNYFKAKRRLFSELLPLSSPAVLNADEPHYQDLLEACKGHRVISYGRSKNADLKLDKLIPEEHSQRLEVTLFGKPYQLVLPLVGEFQTYNALCALGLVVGCGEDLEQAVAGLSSLKTANGRMQKAGMTPGQGAVYIDYAQNMDGMKTALKSIRPYVKGRLTVIFGCGGGRDLSRREGMGIVAQEGADRVIITDDNPRHESPETIRAALLKGCPKGIEIPDRSEAIYYALTTLEKGDVCLIAGKGHERLEIRNGYTYPYNDFEEAQKILKSIGGQCA
jgi:UDP-N-acetylmuramoyl-L-alanyl-D-glutamate--2,6-diaminopimelate ligase